MVRNFRQHQSQPSTLRPTITPLLATETTSLQQSSKAIDLQHSIQNNNYSIPSDGIQPGGRLNKFYNNWIKVISHKWPLSVIREGYKIQLNSNPIPWKLKKMNLKLEDQIAVDQAVEKFMTAGKIEISPSQSRDYLSNFFTIQEATKRRPILDCKMINNYIQCHHFKMEGVPALREVIERNDFICKIDLKDAYVVVPLHQDSRKYLTFLHKNTVYQYKTLAFGMSISPRIFSKIMRYVIEPLRREGIRMT